MPLPDLLLPPALPVAELAAARLDGELIACDDGYLCLDRPDDAPIRASIAALRLPDRVILERETAAWVLGAPVPPPRPVQVCVDARDRARMPRLVHAVVREVRIERTDILLRGRVRITTPLRTICDLARTSPDSPRTRGILLALCSEHRIRPDEIVTALTLRRLPHSLRARSLLDSALDGKVSRR